ncbi:MAG: hypothetical protein HY648_11815, partial [Acidobacteria bacterium]|nr:hypothetical protein [Acidobacteriota bacterium]
MVSSKSNLPEVPNQSERIVVVECRAGQAAKLQRELASNGYLSVLAHGSEDAISILSRQRTALLIVMGTAPPQPRSTRSKFTDSLVDFAEIDAYENCYKLRSHPATRTIPILLVVPVWDHTILTKGLEAGADYFLFAPYQEQDLSRSVRHALLNGLAPEHGRWPAIEVIYQDRTHILTASPSRLGRMLFATFEDYRQSRCTLSWFQAEVAEFRRRLREEQRRSARAVLLQERVLGIAHDFGNLLEIIGTAASLQEGEWPAAVSQGMAMEAALAQAETLVAALRNAAALQEEAPLESVDPAAAVQEAVQAAMIPMRALHIRALLRVERLPPIRCNGVLLSRCLN